MAEDKLIGNVRLPDPPRPEIFIESEHLIS
jgi:hypothetical protein